MLFPVSYLLTSLSLDNKNLSASQTWSTWLNWRLRYNYFRFGKQTFVILEFYFRFRFRPYCRNPHNILHKVVKFDLYRTTESVIDFSRWSHKYNSTSGFLFVNATAFKRSKSISKPNFVDVSQFTAEITILPFWKNKRPQYWNSTSGFDFDYIVAIYVLFASGCPKSSKSDCLLRKYDVMSILKMAAAVAQYYFRFYICWCHCFQKVKIYQQTKCRRHISIHSWYITTSGFEKQVSAILEFFFWFRSRPRRILHHAAEFRPNRTIERRNMTSYWSSKRRPLAMLDLLWDLLACRRVWEKRYKQIHKKWAESAILSFV